MTNIKYCLLSLSLILLAGCKEKQKEKRITDFSASSRDNNTYSLPPSNYQYSEPQTSYNSVGLGDYEAEIEYYNPNTGKYATYYLSVDIEDGQLVRIYFPKGGWWDDSNFDPIDISEGEASFVTYDGKSITVRLLDDISPMDTGEPEREDENFEDEESDDIEDEPY